MNNLCSFHGKNRFRQAILTFIANNIVSQQDKEELLETFKSLDKDGDGELSREELIEGYMKIT